MPYLNLDLDYFTHPKILRLVSRLGAEYVCMPLKLWCHAGKYHAKDGSLKGYTKQELEQILGWTGPSELLFDTLVEINLIENCRGFFKIHDWKEHAGHLEAFKKRAKTANKKRWSKIATGILQGSLDTPPILTNVSNVTNVSKKEEKNKTLFSSDADAIRLSTLLWECIRLRHPEHKEPNLQVWAKSIDRMINLDKRPVADIEAVIRWCQQDPFWQNNILSTDKLRKQYDQLDLKRRSNPLVSRKSTNLQAGITAFLQRGNQ